MGSTFNSLIGLIILALDIWGDHQRVQKRRQHRRQSAVDPVDPAVASAGPDHLGYRRAAR